MENSKIRKPLSLVLAIIMLFTMIPATIFTLASEKTYPIMMRFTAASGDDFHRYYKQVYSVTFLDEIDEEAMAGALESWDISANTGSGEIMSWMYLNEEATAQAGQNMYDVYIAGEGGVGANPESGYIFYMFEGLKEINNPENFKTGTATTFYNTFYGCFSLEEVDFSSWDVSNVTTIKYMFYRCYGLKYANLSGWNTSNITNMYGVFEMTPPNSSITPDYSLEKVDLTGWDTSNVTTMENMFKNCENLKELDLSSFDTSKVTSMRFMFYYCKSLKNIYVGEGWTTEAIKNINDGVFNCCYALVGGKDNQEENIAIYNDKHPSAYYPPNVEYAKTKEEGGYLTDVSHKPEPEKKEYKVTYEFIGDVIPEGVTAPTEATYEEGSNVTVETSPSAEGYVFSGWTTEDATVTDNSFTINNDVHFVGSWKKLYKVEYKYDENYTVPEGAPELPEAQYYTAGEWVDLLGVPYVDRHIFIGWTTDDTDTSGDMFIMPEGDVILYGYYKIPVESVEIMGGDIVLDYDGDDVFDEKLNIYIKPEDATIKEIIYESSDESIVKIDKYGRITAVGEGTATITVKSADDPTKSDTVTVTVKIPVTDITVDKTELNLNKGDEEKITAEVNPEATNKEITYESSDETVVKVDENGNIEAVGEGEATVTVTSKDNPEIKEEIKITVKVPVTELTATEDFTIDVGETKNVEAKVNEDATNKELIYESSNPGVVKVDKDGNVEAVGEGEAIITITSKDDPTKKETVKVTVEVPVEDIIVPEDKKDITLDVGDKDKITVTVTPDNATDKDVTYESSDETVVKVDENGNIEAVGEGEATITITSKDDPTKTETVKVTVEKPEEPSTEPEEPSTEPEEPSTEPEEPSTEPEEPSTEPEEPSTEPEEPSTEPEKIPVGGVTVDKSDITLEEGETDKITVTVKPDNATEKGVTYKSGNESIVKVDENGNITAVGEGTTTVLVISKDDPTKVATVFVTVKPMRVPVEEIITDRDEITLDKGETDKITVTVNPDSATDKGLIYESSDESIVKVDKNGSITAVGEGEAIITVTSKDNPTKKTTVKITVEKPDYSIEVPEFVNIFKGEKKPLGVVITPDDGTIVLTYKSSDESVVKVDAEGNITGVGVGIAVITADFGGGDTRLIPVTVLTVPVKHHVCFGKTDGIGWYEVSINGGDTFLQGPNSTLEVAEGSILVEVGS